jgi:hypothetical protein
MIRALEQAGLIQLDPVVAPTTHVYLVAPHPELDQLRQVAGLVAVAADELHATVTLAALVDVSRAAVPVPADFPIYVMEPVTSHGLVIDPDEYRAAAVELLLAAVQPGGARLLAGRGGTLGTVGIAWLSWSPADLRSGLARRLSREGLARCLETAAPAPQYRGALRELDAWRAQTEPERLAALTRALPDHGSFGHPERRRSRSAHLKRCAAILPRRAERWEQALERNALAQTQREGEALERSLAGALTSGPDGLARARCLAEALAHEAARRRDLPPERPEPPPRLAPALEQLQQAEAAWPVRTVWAGLGIGLLLALLIRYAAHASWGSLFLWAALLAAAGGAYTAWRPRRIDAATRAALDALRARAEAMSQEALLRRLTLMDQLQEARAGALTGDLVKARAALLQLCRTPGPTGAGARSGALSTPLVAGAAAEPIYEQLRPEAGALAAHLAAGGALLRWREPAAALARAEELTAAFLAGRIAADPGQLAAHVYGDRLAEQLYTRVRGLLDWARPLLARSGRLPEEERWLFWPEGLPCPPVPREVQVVPASRGSLAAVTVVRGLEAGILNLHDKKVKEHLA